MSASALASATSGALFGAALGFAGMSSPHLILAQMRLQDYHMLKVFLTGVASSALVMALLDRRGSLKVKPRSPSSLHWFNEYDGNVVGGLAFGIGMTLTGTCPGTVFVQLAHGVVSARYALTGGIFGSALYHPISQLLPNSSSNANANTMITIQSKLGIDRKYAFAGLELACVLAITLLTRLRPNDASLKLHPVLGGIAIGASQLVSLILTGGALGASAFFPHLIANILHAWNPRLNSSTPKAYTPPHQGLTFAAGMVLGALTLRFFFPSLNVDDVPFISPTRALVGGAVLVFGARLAGGCTSGHGISGVSMLSNSSIVTVIAMFAGGIGASVFLN